jgi:hypothetical protein
MLQHQESEIQLPGATEPQATPAMLPLEHLPPSEYALKYMVAVDSLECSNLRLLRAKGLGAAIEDLVQGAIEKADVEAGKESSVLQAALLRVAAQITETWPELVEMAVLAAAFKREMQN